MFTAPHGSSRRWFTRRASPMRSSGIRPPAPPSPSSSTSAGLPSESAGVRHRNFSIANGSLHEVVGALDLAQAIGALAPEPAAAAQAQALRVKRMLRALSAGGRAAPAS